MPEKTLQFIADIIDGELVVCDDGYTINLFLPIEVQKKVGAAKLYLLFDENGTYETSKIHS